MGHMGSSCKVRTRHTYVHVHIFYSRIDERACTVSLATLTPHRLTLPLVTGTSSVLLRVPTRPWFVVVFRLLVLTPLLHRSKSNFQLVKK